MKRLRRAAAWGLLVAVAAFALSLADARSSDAAAFGGQPWYAASRDSAGIAPDPADNAGEAIVQVYAAATFGWRGLVASHPWIIFKRAGQTAYTRYDVVGWRGSAAVQRDYALPDGRWYGARPRLLADHRGAAVEALIDRIEAAIASYPYADRYRSYPGPNSNTFLAHIAREVPQLRLDLPANAIGKDYRPLSDPVGLSPTGSGLQLSLLGVLGVSVGLQEGVEFNVLGLNFGVDVISPGLRLPFIGRIGFADTAVSRDPPVIPPAPPPPAAPAPRGSAG